MNECRKRRYPTGNVAQGEAKRLGYEHYACVACGGWHLTSNGHEATNSLSSMEQAVLMLAREGGAFVDTNGDCFDGDKRHLPESAGAVRSLERQRMIRVEEWGEIVPRRGRRNG